MCGDWSDCMKACAYRNNCKGVAYNPPPGDVDTDTEVSVCGPTKGLCLVYTDADPDKVIQGVSKDIGLNNYCVRYVPAAGEVTEVPQYVDAEKIAFCAQAKTACACAEKVSSECGWSKELNTCMAYGTTDCDECPSQLTCGNRVNCEIFGDPCSCVTRSNNQCAWNPAVRRCVVGQYTSCNFCMDQPRCRATGSVYLNSVNSANNARPGEAPAGVNVGAVRPGTSTSIYPKDRNTPQSIYPKPPRQVPQQPIYPKPPMPNWG